jgi:hypothetical protein
MIKAVFLLIDSYARLQDVEALKVADADIIF